MHCIQYLPVCKSLVSTISMSASAMALLSIVSCKAHVASNIAVATSTYHAIDGIHHSQDHNLLITRLQLCPQDWIYISTLLCIL